MNSDDMSGDSGGEEATLSPSFVKIVLFAITKIRNQKQRPSVERICVVVRQQLNHLSDNDIKNQLRIAVHHGKVLKVNISYIIRFKIFKFRKLINLKCFCSSIIRDKYPTKILEPSLQAKNIR